MTNSIQRLAYASPLLIAMIAGSTGCKDGSVADLILDGPKETVSNAGTNIPDVARGTYVDFTRREVSDIAHEADRARVDLPRYGPASQKARGDVADKVVYDARKTTKRCWHDPERCGTVIRGNR